MHAALHDGWRVWRWFQVRGAGFPVDKLLQFGASDAARAVDGGSADAPSVFLAAQASQRELLRAIASDETFREAVMWQNRNAVTEGLDSLLRKPMDATDARTRRKELMVASYLQRYTAKNDTIGFFGPIGWSRIDDGVAAIDGGQGRRLVKRRRTYFEPWAIQAVASAHELNPAVRIYLSPRIRPQLWMEDGRLFGVPGVRSHDGGLPLEDAEALLLQFCTGQHPAYVIAAHLAGEAPDLFPDESSVYDGMLALEERKWLWWGLDVPSVARPEDALLEALQSIGDDEARATAEADLKRLVDARDAVADAAGDADRLLPALLALDETFKAITGRDASRNAGQTYAGRTIIYEDCQRDVDIRLGRAVLERAARPLALMLRSARWFTHEVARRYQRVFDAAYDELASRHGDPVPLPRLWDAVMPHLHDLTPPIFADVTLELQQRWAQLLEASESVDGMEQKSRELFNAPHPGWPGARHHCPDLLIAAPSMEAIRAGRFQVVVGEVHAGLCVFSTLSATQQHDRPEDLSAAYAEDIGVGIAPVAVDTFARSSHDSRLASEDFHLEVVPHGRSWRAPGKVLRLGDMVVSRVDDCLRVSTRDGAHGFDVMQVFERPLKMRSAVNFNPFPSSSHAPRIVLDGVVLARERWSFPADALGFASADTAFDRFAGARRWAGAHGLPRFIFIKSPAEVKPCFVDLESPILVELLCKQARGAATLSVSEMLPAPPDLWLTDGDGHHFTSELRMVAVDPEPWRPMRREQA